MPGLFYSGKTRIGETGEPDNSVLPEIVSAVKPMWVVFENVYNIERFSTVTVLKQMLSDAGYGITTRVLDASRCGVPQKRQRFFLVGKLGEKNGFLDDVLISNLSDK